MVFDFELQNQYTKLKTSKPFSYYSRPKLPTSAHFLSFSSEKKKEKV
jgi:hypothetical protein